MAGRERQLLEIQLLPGRGIHVPRVGNGNSCRDILARPLHPAKYRKIGMAVVQGNRSLLIETFYDFARDLLEESGDYILA